MQEDGQFASNGDDGSFLGRFATALSESEAVAAQVAVLSEGPEDVLRALHEELA